MAQISVYTADGMLTRATPIIPPGNRARKITVGSKNIGEGKQITVSITPNIILSFATPNLPITEGNGNGLQLNHKIHGRDRGMKWHGWAWVFTDTLHWVQTQFYILERESIQAYSVENAVVEHLRYILNKELRIRPLITDRVCIEVTSALATRKELQHTFVGMRTKIEQPPVA
jgi:hypothetical protein